MSDGTLTMRFEYDVAFGKKYAREDALRSYRASKGVEGRIVSEGRGEAFTASKTRYDALLIEVGPAE